MIVYLFVFIHFLPWYLFIKRGDMILELLKFESKLRFCIFQKKVPKWANYQNDQKIVDAIGGPALVDHVHRV